MTDESNGESGFEFVEKKLEEFSDTPKNDLINSGVISSSLTVVTPGVNPNNIVTNIGPPSALPTFVTNTIPTSTITSQNSIQALLKDENIKHENLLPENIQSKESSISVSSDNMPQVLIAPDSPTMDTGALAGSLFTWVKDTVANSTVLSKVAEKAKNSVNSMITTLDPQMREFIYSGGDIEIIVASDKDTKVAPVREAFQNVFGNATVNGFKVETTFEVVQPVGFAAGVEAAQKRIAAVREISADSVNIPVVAVENFLLEVDEDKWYDLGVILLEDINQNVHLQTFTQMTPVPSQIVKAVQELTPENYSKKGLAVTIGSLMSANLQVSHTEWHNALTGVSRKDIIFLAAQSLAGIYKNTINPV